ncbi:lipopolysaccharide biosynthesis protein [Cetobacterium ceti]
MKKYYQKIKTSKVLKNISLLFSGTFISSILGFVNIGLLVKSIGLEFNGIIYLSQSYVDFFNSLLNFQSFDAIVKYLPKYMEPYNKKGKNYIKLGILFDFITAIFSFCAGYVCLKYIGKYFKWNEDIIKYIKIILLIIPFTLNGSLSGILRVYSKFKELTYANIFLAILTTIFYWIGYILKFNLNVYIYFIVVRAILKFCIDLYLTLNTLKTNKMLDMNFLNIKYDKEFIKFCIGSSVSKMLDIPVVQLVPMIISKYLGIVDVAVYKILEKIGGIISVITGIIFQVVGPEISKKIAMNKTKEAVKIVNFLMKSILILGVIASIVIFFTGKYWLNFLIPDYNKYIYEIYLYLIFIIIVNAFVGYYPLFLYSGFVKETIYILIFINSTYLVYLYYLVIGYQLKGVILSRIIQSGLITLSKYIILKKRKILN